jgi:hypothetical protein
MSKSLVFCLAGLLLASATFLASPSFATDPTSAPCANDDCNQVLTVATEFLRLDTSESLTSHVHQWLRTATREEVSTASEAGLDLSVFGLPSPSVSDNEWRKFEQQRDEGRIDQISMSKVLSMAKSGPNHLAIAAWRECILANRLREGLQVMDEELQIKTIDGEKKGFLTLRLQYNRGQRPSDPTELKIDNIRVSSELSEDKDYDPNTTLPMGAQRTLRAIPIPLDAQGRFASFTLTIQPLEGNEYVRKFVFRPYKEHKQVLVSVNSMQISLNGGNRFTYSVSLELDGASTVQTPSLETFDVKLGQILTVRRQLEPGESLTGKIVLRSGGIGGGVPVTLYTFSIPYGELSGTQYWQSPEFNFRRWETPGGPLPQYGAVSISTTTDLRK